jgi:transposase
MAEKNPSRADKPESVETTVRTIRRATRKKYSAEERIRIVLEGLRGETSLRELCRPEGIATNQYYTGPRNFLKPASSGGWATPPGRRAVAK